MKPRIFAPTVLLLMSALGAAVQSFPAHAESAQSVASEMTWAEYSALGEPHEMLARRVGTWDIEVKSWEAPGVPPVESEGVSNNKLILGGRFLLQETTHTVHGMQFQVVSIMGFDNLNEKFEGVWMNNSGTGMSFLEGSAGYAESGVTSTTGKIHLHQPGNLVTARNVQRFVDENALVTEMYLQDEEGNEWKRLEMVFTRAN
ncbi:MAG: DUF1579 domain-containing protein [Halieaceae bacterium]|jgi:hypothetical protein|nr:DUF1579 domain-containing protein [Halieaceae bacterium]